MDVKEVLCFYKSNVEDSWRCHEALLPGRIDPTQPQNPYPAAPARNGSDPASGLHLPELFAPECCDESTLPHLRANRDLIAAPPLSRNRQAFALVDARRYCVGQQGRRAGADPGRSGFPSGRLLADQAGDGDLLADDGTAYIQVSVLNQEDRHQHGRHRQHWYQQRKIGPGPHGSSWRTLPPGFATRRSWLPAAS